MNKAKHPDNRLQELEEENLRLKDLLSTTDLNSEDPFLAGFMMFSKLLDQTGDAFFLFPIGKDNLPGQFADVNSKACSDTGFERQDLLQITPYDLDMEKFFIVDKEILNALFTNGYYEKFVNQTNASGYVYKAKLILRLVSRAKNAWVLCIVHEESGKVNETSAASILDLDMKTLAGRMPVGFSVFEDKRLLFSNSCFEKITGYAFGEVSKNKNLSWIDPGKIEKLNELEIKQESGTIEYLLKCKDGTEKFVRDIISFFPSETGEGFRVTLTDDLNNFLPNLKESEYFKQITENLDVAIFIRNIDGSLIFVSQGASKIWKRPLSELQGDLNAHFQHIHPSDKAIFENALQSEAFVRNKWMDIRLRILRPDGEIRWIWARTFPVCNDNGHLYRIAGMVLDITDQKNYEIDILQEKEKAVESNRLKNLFLGNISHEIRTPLNGIAGFSDLLRDGDLSPQKRDEYVDSIHAGSNQLLGLINDIVDFSKIESGNITIANKQVEINEILNQVKSLLVPKAEKKNLQFTIDFASYGLPVNTDMEKIIQVIANLMDVSVKFSVDGNLKIGCLGKDNHVEFYFKDTGLIIPLEKIKDTFEPFFQFNLPGKATFGTAGLSLSIARSLVEKLGGVIWIESDSTKGTVFYFTIPIGQVVLPKSQEIITEGETEFKILPDTAILIVEDDDTNFMLLRETLRKTGANIIWSKNGVDAVEQCRKNYNIALVLMDIQLPLMNGYDATREIKKFRPSLPVIAQTAYAMYSDVVQSLDAGCDDFIPKPIKIKKLLATVEKYLRINNSISS